VKKDRILMSGTRGFINIRTFPEVDNYFYYGLMESRDQGLGFLYEDSGYLPLISK